MSWHYFKSLKGNIYKNNIWKCWLGFLCFNFSNYKLILLPDVTRDLTLLNLSQVAKCICIHFNVCLQKHANWVIHKYQTRVCANFMMIELNSSNYAVENRMANFRLSGVYFCRSYFLSGKLPTGWKLLGEGYQKMVSEIKVEV